MQIQGQQFEIPSLTGNRGPQRKAALRRNPAAVQGLRASGDEVLIGRLRDLPVQAAYAALAQMTDQGVAEAYHAPVDQKSVALQLRGHTEVDMRREVAQIRLRHLSPAARQRPPQGPIGGDPAIATGNHPRQQPRRDLRAVAQQHHAQIAAGVLAAHDVADHASIALGDETGLRLVAQVVVHEQFEQHRLILEESGQRSPAQRRGGDDRRDAAPVAGPVGADTEPASRRCGGGSAVLLPDAARRSLAHRCGQHTTHQRGAGEPRARGVWRRPR